MSDAERAPERPATPPHEAARLRRLLENAQRRIADLEATGLRLARLTLTDDVTGLNNQRALFARLDEELRRRSRYGGDLTAMMIDVDYFKAVNDGHDHLFGSRVLRRLGGLIKAGVRDSDFVARYGGDEFVVVLPHTDLAAATAAAARLRALIAVSNVGDDRRPLAVTISAGIATASNAAATTAEQLLRTADQAMYAAKAAGRNRVVAAGAQGVPRARSA